MKSRYERRAAKARPDDDTTDVLGAVVLTPPAGASDAGKQIGRMVGGGVGMLAGELVDRRRRAAQDAEVPEGATLPIDGDGYFVYLTEAHLYVHAGSHKGDLVLRSPREEIRIDAVDAGSARTPVVVVGITTGDGEVLIGQMEREGYARAIRRFTEAAPSTGA